ncbi:Plant specific Rop nucleotide exchanger, PRONE [Cynara cardunculus var. scolymus]|uniref:Plant specific Rop nucleotide exchanger, PRONE n=1 Tax=Cynara cardunculus var. scolymus TaxID=59895 RepID=A0A118JYL6_CYNCS|nr:Plant specific Rop nucleotide exchanger, PRONE [Cynara cardunculus var. scolymus]
MEEDQSDAMEESCPELEAIYADMELMKERFAKLLLGEDMSGGGKGVSSALALSNAITNLAGTQFPSFFFIISSHFVIFMEEIAKLGDTIRTYSSFLNCSCFTASVFGEISRLEPMPPDGKARWRKEIDWLLSVTDHIVEFVPSKQNTNGIIMEIMVTRQRSDVHVNIPALKKLDLMLMECLDNFKDQNEFTYNGRASLGDSIYKNITVDHFDPDHFLSAMDLSSEHKIVDLKNRIEASVVIWRRKMTNKDGKSGWGSGVSLEKREQFEDRAETILLILKHRYPGIPQSSLDISKIEHNRSYSRILESLAHKVMSRIEDVMHADNLAQNPSGDAKRNPLKDAALRASGKFPNAKEELEKLNRSEAPTSMTLSDFMGWSMDQEKESRDELSNGNDSEPPLAKQPSATNSKKLSYLEKLDSGRSPMARQ